MAAKKRKVRGQKHPGVVLMKPNEKARAWWRARFVDPDSGDTAYETLPRTCTSAELREGWAKWKAAELEKRAMELDAGAPRLTGMSLEAAVDRYFDDHPHLSERSKEDYRASVNFLLAWGRKHGVTSADELTRARLLAYRASAIKRPKQATFEGSKRGGRVETSKPRAPETINSELRKVGTVLSYLRGLELLPKLTSDGLKDGLKKVRVTRERIEHLSPAECKKLLEAALRHDAAVFKVTRAEHDQGTHAYGQTPRYPSVAPFVAFVLLTGMRLGEAVGVQWKQVDLDALDHDGAKVGEIHLRGGDVKTGSARTVDLAVSPALRTLLASLKLASGGKGAVFSLTEHAAESAAKRLRNEYGAPPRFGWQMLRRTCGTYLTNAPGIFGAASAYRSARQLGHSVQVAERHYLGLVRGIPREARTLEAAMQIESELEQVIARVGKPASANVVQFEVAR